MLARRQVSVSLSTRAPMTEVDDRRVSQAVPGRRRYRQVPNDPTGQQQTLVAHRHLSEGDDWAHDDMPVELVIGLGRLVRSVLTALRLLLQQRPSRQVQLLVQVAVMADDHDQATAGNDVLRDNSAVGAGLAERMPEALVRSPR